MRDHHPVRTEAPSRLPYSLLASRRLAAALWLVAGLGTFTLPGPANADDVTDSIIAINNEFLTDTRLTSTLLVAGPPEVAREIAIIDSAMYDAANAASGSPGSSIAYTGGPVTGASVDIAALSAGYTALEGIFSNLVWQGVPDPTNLVGGSAAIQTQVLTSIGTSYTNALTSLEAVDGTGGLTVSLALGQAAGTANLVANGYILGTNGLVTTAYDTGPGGSYAQIAEGIVTPYVPAIDPGTGNPAAGTYVPPSTDPTGASGSTRVAMFPDWGTVAPVGPPAMTTLVAQVLATAPPAPDITSQFYAQNLLQTECEGSGTPIAPASALGIACAAAGFAPETVAQAAAALFWNDPGSTAQPPGHWLAISDTLAQQQNLSTVQAARMGALVGEALDDAGIVAWGVKYQPQNLLWRPVTAISSSGFCNGDGSVTWSAYFTTCDPGWTSLIATPPHPDYVAGHPAFSGAAATVLQNFLGTDNITFTSVSDAYCNGGATLRDPATQLIAACTTASGAFAFNDGTTTFNTIYTSPSGCASVGGTLGSEVDSAATLPSGPVTLATCTIGTTTYVFDPAENPTNGCNDIINSGGANDSLLICPISETFNSISQASSGANGAEFSRVVGGIHTPIAVEEALALGDEIGQDISNQNNIPEPGTIGLLIASIGLMGTMRRLRHARPGM